MHFLVTARRRDGTYVKIYFLPLSCRMVMDKLIERMAIKFRVLHWTSMMHFTRLESVNVAITF